MFTDLTEGSYYVVRGEPNAENAKKYNFTVQDTARQQNWNVPVFTLRSAIALAVLAVIAAGVIWLLVFLPQGAEGSRGPERRKERRRFE